LRELVLDKVHFDTDYKIGLMNGFMAGNKKITKIKLSQNSLNSLEILSQMFINKTMKSLDIVHQSYFKTSLISQSQPKNFESEMSEYEV